MLRLGRHLNFRSAPNVQPETFWSLERMGTHDVGNAIEYNVKV